MDWYTLAIIAMFFYGIQNFLFKVSAEKKCNSAWTTFSFMVTVAVISSSIFIFGGHKILNFSLLLILASVNAIAFLITIISRMEALKHIAVSTAYPIMRMSLVLVVIFSVIFFKDKLSMFQLIGIILAIVVVILLTKNDKKHARVDKNFKFGLTLTFIALIFSAITTIGVKFAADYTNLIAFISLTYILNTVLSFSLRNRLQTKNENPQHKNAIIIGIFIGLVNFFGFYVLLKAMKAGPLSIVSTINSLYFLIAIILAAIIYKEKLTKEKVLAVLLSILAVILMGM